MIEVREATLDDLPAITAMYNDAIVHSVSTFDVEPRTPARAHDWFRKHGEKHPVLVAREGDEVVGWASLNVFVGRGAYEHTVEDSVYVSPGRQRRGVGAMLLGRLIERAGELGHRSIVARIADHSEASLALHRSCGFTKVGVLREVGRKFDRWIDVTLMQLVLG